MSRLLLSPPARKGGPHSQPTRPGESGSLSSKKMGANLNFWPWGTWTGGILWITNHPYVQSQFQAEGDAKLLCPPPPLLLKNCSELGGQHGTLGRQHKLSSYLRTSSTA